MVRRDKVQIWRRCEILLEREKPMIFDESCMKEMANFFFFSCFRLFFLSHTPFYTRKAEDAYMINVNNNSMNWQKKLRERNKQIREFIKKKTRIKSLVALLFYPSWRKNSDDGKANSDKHIQLFFFFLFVF